MISQSLNGYVLKKGQDRSWYPDPSCLKEQLGGEGGDIEELSVGPCASHSKGSGRDNGCLRSVDEGFKCTIIMSTPTGQ
jgi:hypothetical protein